MTTWFVSRHPGALQWAQQNRIDFDHTVEHLDMARVQAGDRVIGSLPVNLAAEVCALGAEYHHLSLQLPHELRGQELSAEQLAGIGAHLQQYRIEAL
jgi:CRISPR-associated protein Csx16